MHMLEQEPTISEENADKKIYISRKFLSEYACKVYTDKYEDLNFLQKIFVFWMVQTPEEAFRGNSQGKKISIYTLIRARNTFLEKYKAQDVDEYDEDINGVIIDIVQKAFSKEQS